MRRAGCVVVLLVLLSAAPGGAAWPVRGTAATDARMSRVTALPAPSVTPSCLVGGSIGLDIRWVASEPWLTGYEVWRSVDGTVAKVADVPAGTRQTTDVQISPRDLRYWIVSEANAWSATGVTHIVSDIPVCALSPTSTTA